MKLEPELAEILVDIEVSSQRYRTILQFFHPHIYMLIIGALVNLRAQVGYVRVLITLQSSSYVGTGAGLTKIMKAASADLYWCVFNPVHPYIRMHIFYSTLNKFPMALTRRICLKIKSFWSLWSFSVFS